MMTIGEVMDALKTADQTVHVRFAFGGIVPTIVASWRGIYADAALGFKGGDYGSSEHVTVEELTKRLEAAIAPLTEYTGWKGGEYHYDRDTPLHIDNPGCCTNTELTRVEVGEYEVILHTERNDA